MQINGSTFNASKLFFNMILLHILLSILFSKCESVEVIVNDDYMGEKFPVKYLEPEEYQPTLGLLDMYIDALSKTVHYYAANPNFTEVNKALGSFMTHAIIQRTLLDDGHKLTKDQRSRMNDIARKADYVVSHHVYDDQYIRMEDMSDISYRVSQLFKESEILMQSLKKFNKRKLKKWIKSKGRLHEFLEEIDMASLPKEKYVELVDASYLTYFIKIEDSDTCLSRVIYNPPPAPKDTDLRPCKKDPLCHTALHASPSISYGLSHRMLNLWVYRSLRHCYWVSPEADELHIDILCAFMYREVVYIARRGYFARDLFLEHIALCAMLGYEEFFRPHWFRKAISWMDEEGCIQENHNFEINRTARFIRTGKPNDTEIKILRTSLQDRLHDVCHIHPMALLIVVLSNAIRHAAHLLPNSS